MLFVVLGCRKMCHFDEGVATVCTGHLRICCLLEPAYELGNRLPSLTVMSSNPGSRSIWIVSSFVTQHADRRPEYLACLLRAPLALFIKETERRDDMSMAH
jgi:hypothetical protein